MQYDIFDETLQNKILRMEKWMMRLHKELNFLKQVNEMRDAMKPKESIACPKIEQMSMFG